MLGCKTFCSSPLHWPGTNSWLRAVLPSASTSKAMAAPKSWPPILICLGRWDGSPPNIRRRCRWVTLRGRRSAVATPRWASS
ncbi:Uncharacterised protein [Mycobacteroides abscessus subsp. abscessus]|nr:Uncharacterised protein [Mycobacteroides abscessus subsp. abscessus]